MTAIPAPTGTPSFRTTVAEVAVRAWHQISRSPQIIGIALVQSVLFLVMFRYVIGGAIGVQGLSYVDFLIPGFVVSGLVFTANGSAVAVAEDAASGVHDRFRSLPIPDLAVLTGRALADTALLTFVALVTTGVGVLIGFRPDAPVGDLVAAIALLPVFAFAVAWVFQFIGLVAGNGQAAQGLGIIGVPFSFVSSAFVPVETMPAVLEPFARYQPLSFMIDAVRGLTLGEAAIAVGGQSLSTEIVGALLWTVAIVVVFGALGLRRYRRR
jgi:ABC-2 type transport system permease protein